MLWNQKFLALGIVIVAAAVGFGLSELQPDTYEAEATVVVIDPSTAQELTDQMGLERNASRNTATQAAFMESLDPSIDTSIERDTGIITVTSTASTPSGPVVAIEGVFTEYASFARAKAESAAAELLIQLDEQQTLIEAEIPQLEANIAADPSDQTSRSRLGSAINELRFIERNRVKLINQLATYDDGVQMYTAPMRPDVQTSDIVIRNTVLAAALGLLIALSVAWVRGADA